MSELILKDDEQRVLIYLEERCPSPDVRGGVKGATLCDDLELTESDQGRIGTTLKTYGLVDGRQVDGGPFTRMWITPFGQQIIRGQRAKPPSQQTAIPANIQQQLVELQSQIVDPQISISILLQKVIVLAARANDQEFAEWAKREIVGVKKGSPHAEYRNLKGDYVVRSPDGHSTPIAWDDPTNLRTRFVTGPISELESLYSGSSNTFGIVVDTDPRTMHFNQPVEPGSKVVFQIGRPTVAACFSTIRQRVLDWTIKCLSSVPEELTARKASESSWSERLQSARDDLALMPEYPWGQIEAWMAKVTPMIRQEWPDHFEDFKNATKKPRQYFLVPGKDPSETNAKNQQFALQAKSRILGFIDGLIQVAQLRDRAVDVRQTRSAVEEAMATGRDTRNVFVVHGRNMVARDAIFSLLRAVDLNPLEWERIVHATGKGSPYVGDVLKKGFEIAQAIVVLMTPDDEARLTEQLWKTDEEPHEKVLTPQPRPNVILEAGMALGMNEDRTIIVEMGQLRPISDLLGRHAVRMADTAEARQKLVQRLKAAGCTLKDEGADWLRAGDFRTPSTAATSTTHHADQKPRLFASNDVLWRVDDRSGMRIYQPHCPQCHAPLSRKADFVKCTKCSFEELLAVRNPSQIPADLS